MIVCHFQKESLQVFTKNDVNPEKGSCCGKNFQSCFWVLIVWSHAHGSTWSGILCMIAHQGSHWNEHWHQWCCACCTECSCVDIIMISQHISNWFVESWHNHDVPACLALNISTLMTSWCLVHDAPYNCSALSLVLKGPLYLKFKVLFNEDLIQLMVMLDFWLIKQNMAWLFKSFESFWRSKFKSLKLRCISKSFCLGLQSNLIVCSETVDFVDIRSILPVCWSILWGVKSCQALQNLAVANYEQNLESIDRPQGHEAWGVTEPKTHFSAETLRQKASLLHWAILIDHWDFCCLNVLHLKFN